jgi:hypothetical protein
MATGRVDIVEQGPRGPRWVGMVVLVALVAVPLIGDSRQPGHRPSPPDRYPGTHAQHDQRDTQRRLSSGERAR